MIVRTSVAVCILMMFAPACGTGVAAPDCSAPTLVTGSTSSFNGESTMVLWNAARQGEDVTPDFGAHDPAMSPDGRTVAYASAAGMYSDSSGWEQSRVALLAVESRELTLLSADIPGSTVRELEWAADGSEVAFYRQLPDGTREIAAVRVTDGEERQLVELAYGQGYGSFGWSPDESELLIPTSSAELRRYSIATGDYVHVETPHTIVEDVTWSPDGRMVALKADIPGVGRIRQYVLDIETGESQPVDRRRGFPQSATWSGPYLFYAYNSWEPNEHIELMRWDSITMERVRIDRPDLDPFGIGLVTVSAPHCSSPSG